MSPAPPRPGTMISSLPNRDSETMHPHHLFIASVDEDVQDIWPPQDPTRRSITYGNSDDETPVILPESGPWTYGSEGPNPALRPSSQRLRQRSRYPPYHPLYATEENGIVEEAYSESDSESSAEESFTLRRRVRRGSEGYEVQHVSRDDMFQPYMPSEAVRRRFNEPQPKEGHHNLDSSSSDTEPLSSIYTRGNVV